MKVRRKLESERISDGWDVVESSPNFYITDNAVALPKSMYEPVPTEQWRDVHDSVWFQFNYGFDENGNQIEGPFKARFDVVRKKA